MSEDYPQLSYNESHLRHVHLKAKESVLLKHVLRLHLIRFDEKKTVDNIVNSLKYFCQLSVLFEL